MQSVAYGRFLQIKLDAYSTSACLPRADALSDGVKLIRVEQRLLL